MSLLNGIASFDPRSAVSGFIENAVSTITGSERLGSAAGLIADLKSGNVLGAVLRGRDLALEVLQDLPATAELRWGPGAFVKICGLPAQVAETCPGPAGEQGFKLEVHLGLLGWGAVVRLSDFPLPGDAAPESSPSVSGILDDPSLSLEAKVALLFAELIDDLDGQVEGKLGELDDASRAQQRDKAGGGDGEASGNDFNKISTEVQMLMQKRSQMYGLQSNMMSMFNDVSMQVINNVR